MRNLTVCELVGSKPPVVSLHGVEKVANIVDMLKNTTHNVFPVLDDADVPQVSLADGATELHWLILRAHLIKVLKRRWFLTEGRSTEDWEVREKFTWVELAEREDNFEEVAVMSAEMQMYVDLHPLTNMIPYTVVESMSVAKAIVLFRQVGLRRSLFPRSKLQGCLRWSDLNQAGPKGIQAFPHLEKSKGGKGH